MAVTCFEKQMKSCLNNTLADNRILFVQISFFKVQLKDHLLLMHRYRSSHCSKSTQNRTRMVTTTVCPELGSFLQTSLSLTGQVASHGQGLQFHLVLCTVLVQNQSVVTASAKFTYTPRSPAQHRLPLSNQLLNQ